VDDQMPDRRKIIFDPLPRIDGIDSSGDPLTDVRADIYLLSGRRRPRPGRRKASTAATRRPRWSRGMIDVRQACVRRGDQRHLPETW